MDEEDRRLTLKILRTPGAGEFVQIGAMEADWIAAELERVWAGEQFWRDCAEDIAERVAAMRRRFQQEGEA